MSHKKKQKVLGFLIFSLGIGIMLAIMVPVIGWIAFSAICLICAGVYLLRNC